MLACDNCGEDANYLTMEVVFLPVTRPFGKRPDALDMKTPEIWCPECQMTQVETYDVRVSGLHA